MARIVFVALILFIGSEAALLRHKRVAGESPACPEDCSSAPMDVAFVVDASSSIWPENFVRCLTFIEDFAKQFEISPTAVRMSLVTFGWGASGAFSFEDHTSKQELENIASHPDNVVNATSYAQLNLIKEDLVDVTCNGILRKVGQVGSEAKQRFKIKFPDE